MKIYKISLIFLTFFLFVNLSAYGGGGGGTHAITATLAMEAQETAVIEDTNVILYYDDSKVNNVSLKKGEGDTITVWVKDSFNNIAVTSDNKINDTFIWITDADNKVVYKSWTNGTYFNGTIDDLMRNKTLSTEEIGSLYSLNVQFSQLSLKQKIIIRSNRLFADSKVFIKSNQDKIFLIIIFLSTLISILIKFKKSKKNQLINLK